MAITQAQKTFLETVGALASADMKNSGVLASLTMAQAILESGWGTSELALKANALFGIKAGTAWGGKVYSKETKECYDGVTFTEITALFRAYESWETSVQDHSAFLRAASRYAAVIGETDYKKACTAIHAAGYATDPEYANKLVNLIETYGLNQYDGISEPTEGINMAKIAVYAGHGGSDPGAVCGARKEKDYTLNVSNAVTAILKSAGYTVINNRTTDIDRNLDTDAKNANNNGVDAVVEIHLNSNAGTPGTGVETFYSVTGRGKELATAIQNKIVALGFKDRGIKTRANSSGGDYFGIIRIPSMPSVLIETAFINNDTDMSLYHVDSMAKAIAEGITQIYTTSGGGSNNQNNTNSGCTSESGVLAVGAVVNFTGSTHYASSTAASGTACKPGKATVTKVTSGTAHPYHLVKISDGGSTVYGWVNAADIQEASGGSSPVMRVGAMVNYSGPLYSTSYGENPGKSVNGSYTVTQYIAGRKCGVHLGSIGWVPETACTVIS